MWHLHWSSELHWNRSKAHGDLKPADIFLTIVMKHEGEKCYLHGIHSCLLGKYCECVSVISLIIQELITWHHAMITILYDLTLSVLTAKLPVGYPLRLLILTITRMSTLFENYIHIGNKRYVCKVFFRKKIRILGE